jgi:LPS export ABC transporter protein LptC
MRSLLLLLAAVSALSATACGKGAQPPVAGGAGLADSAEQVMFDVRSNLTESGVKRGQMFADTAYVFDDQSRFVMRRLRANFNTETGAPNGTLKGDRGTYDRRAQVLEGFGNVVVTSTDGRRLLSNHLKYAQGTNTISSDSAFTFYRGKDVQKGIGFTTDPNITVFRCLRACRSEGDVQIGNITP